MLPAHGHDPKDCQPSWSARKWRCSVFGDGSLLICLCVFSPSSRQRSVATFSLVCTGQSACRAHACDRLVCARRAALCCHAHTDDYSALLQRAVAPPPPSPVFAFRTSQLLPAPCGCLEQCQRQPSKAVVCRAVGVVGSKSHTLPARAAKKSEAQVKPVAFLALQVPERVRDAHNTLSDTARCNAVQEEKCQRKDVQH
jgi:hypothetical protein